MFTPFNYVDSIALLDNDFENVQQCSQELGRPASYPDSSMDHFKRLMLRPQRILTSREMS